MGLEQIKEHVDAHYAGSEEPLLLSGLGSSLRESGAWPITGELRTLAEVVEALSDDLTLVRDPDARAYLVVVPKGKEALAEAAIERRRDVRFLRRLARPILLAFCIDVSTDAVVFVKTSPPFRYSVNPQAHEDDEALVEAEFRTPGLYIENLEDLNSDQTADLAGKIRKWAERHNLQVDLLTREEAKSHRGPTESADIRGEPKTLTALERLYAAQPEGVAAKMVVPFDIAISLSRLP